MLPLTIAKHVFILGADGAGNATEFADIENYRRIFNRGTWTQKGQTVIPPISAPGWGAMLHSSNYLDISNSYIERNNFSLKSIYPSIFRLIYENYENPKMAAFVNWSALCGGIIENDIGVECHVGADEDITNQAVEYIKAEKPTLFYIHIGMPDTIGHRDGFFTQAHFDAISYTDTMIGQLLDAIEDAGLMDESLIIASTDHGGGGVFSKLHAFNVPKDMTIFYAAMGPGIPQNQELEVNVRIQDVAAVVLNYMEIEPPFSYQGRVPHLATQVAPDPDPSLEDVEAFYYVPEDKGKKTEPWVIAVPVVCCVVLFAAIAIFINVRRKREKVLVVDSDQGSDPLV